MFEKDKKRYEDSIKKDYNSISRIYNANNRGKQYMESTKVNFDRYQSLSFIERQEMFTKRHEKLIQIKSDKIKEDLRSKSLMAYRRAYRSPINNSKLVRLVYGDHVPTQV